MPARNGKQRNDTLRWTSNSIKRACKQCAQAKKRCNLERPQCSRCKRQNLDCQHGPPNATQNTNLFGQEHASLHAVTLDTRSQSYMASGTQNVDSGLDSPRSATKADLLDKLDFTDLDLVATTDSVLIGNRWMEPFVPSSNQRPKMLQPFTLQFLECVLKTYPPSMRKRGSVPPFIHPMQVRAYHDIPRPLHVCFELVRQWDASVPGHGNMGQRVQEEMEKLRCQYRDYDQVQLLAAFQAFLIYALMAYSTSPSGTGHTTIVYLQEIASHVATMGLVCSAEASHLRPTWESWIIAAAKRRTIYTAYMFQNLFNAVNGDPLYLAEELASLPVPATKVLWEATEREIWAKEYDRHLKLWPDGELLISELWFSATETGSTKRRDRIERWVQGVDEFGMTLFATCAHIHGC